MSLEQFNFPEPEFHMSLGGSEPEFHMSLGWFSPFEPAQTTG